MRTLKLHHTRAATDLRRKIASLSPSVPPLVEASPSRPNATLKKSRLNHSILPPSPFSFDSERSSSDGTTTSTFIPPSSSSSSRPAQTSRSITTSIGSSSGPVLSSGASPTPLAKHASLRARARRELQLSSFGDGPESSESMTANPSSPSSSSKSNRQRVESATTTPRRTIVYSSANSSPSTSSFPMAGSSLYGSTSSASERQAIDGSYMVLRGDQDPFQRFWAVIEGTPRPRGPIAGIFHVCPWLIQTGCLCRVPCTSRHAHRTLFKSCGVRLGSGWLHLESSNGKGS